MEDNDAVQLAQSSLSKIPANSSTIFQQRCKAASSGPLPSQFLHRQQKLYERIKNLNKQGISLIEEQKYSQALQCFAECEKILEYAASCGKTLDRNIILTVLHNEALIFQRCDSYQRSASYVEAIIYNLNASLESKEYFHFLLELEEYYFQGSNSIEKDHFIKASQTLFRDYKRKKQEAVMYFLQFAGLQSQYQNHEESLATAQKALANLKELFQWCQRFQRLNNDRNQSQYHRLKDLSLLSLQFSQSQYISLKKQFDKLLSDHLDPSCSKDTITSSCENSIKIDLQEIFSLCPRVVKPSQSQEDCQAGYISLASLEGGVKRIYMLVAIYFTIGVQIEEICAMEKKEKCGSIYLVGGSNFEEKSIGNLQSEMYNLMALIISFKYLPPKSNLLNHILQIYEQTYKRCHEPSSFPSNSKSINKNLDLLTQKYKNYLVQKEISLSLDDGSSSILKADPQQQKKWNQQKKQSKKLKQLFKQQPIYTNFRTQQQNYFLQVPSIDSISIGNSNSKIQFKLQTASSIEEGKNLQFDHRKRVFFNTKIKPARKNMGYNVDYEGGNSNIKNQAQSIISVKQKEDENAPDKKIKNVQSQQLKSKSMKKSKSKTKLIQTKKIQKSPKNTLHQIPISGLMTTITQRSSKKLKSKKSEKDIKHIMGSAGQQYSKWMGQSKKIISNEQIKPFRSNHFGSAKQITQQIKLNKVKSPLNPDGKTANTVRFERPRPLIAQNSDRNSRNKSKSKNSASFKGKKSISNGKNPLGSKKSLTKTIPTSKDKIYTSIKQTIRKR